MNEIVYEKRITSNNGNDGVNENKINLNIFFYFNC